MSEDLFSDDRVNLSLLRQRAFNLRWAMQDSDVIPLTAADPDFPVAQEIRDAMAQYASEGILSYGHTEGLPEFRQAVSQFLSEKKKIPCTEDRILAVDGAASGMFTIARFALKPGDETLIFDPVDFLFQQSVEAAGAKVVRIPLNPDDGSFDSNQVRTLISPRTRLLGICNPHNPLGHVLTAEELRFLGELAIEHNLWILNDLIWSDIVYPPNKYTDITSLSPAIAERTLSIYGFSKSFGLAGLRVGCIASPNSEAHAGIAAASRVGSTAGGVSTLSQIAATAALNHCNYWLEAFLRHLQEVRDETAQRLNNIPGMSCKTPEGTYLLFPDIRSLKMSSTEAADFFLKEAHVAVVPGASRWFGPGAEGHIRICFSTSKKIIREALDRMEAAVRRRG